MNALARFEAFMQELMDHRVVRMLGGALQPVELAHALARCIDSQQRYGVAPDDFEVLVQPEEAAELRALDPSLEAKLTEYVVGCARERALNFGAAPRVRLVADPEVPVGTVRVAAQLSGPSQRPRPRPKRQARDGTPSPAALRLEVPAPDDEVTSVPVERFPFTIGRQPGAALVLSDARVSRRHAVIEQVDGRFRLRDLSSHNGTSLNGEPVAEADLRDHDRVGIGPFQVVVRIGA